MDSEPVTAKSLGWTYMINANTFEKAYKDTLSGFSTWEQESHAEQWVLRPENIGPRIGIDETSFCHELYTIVHNKDGHGKKGSIIAIVKGVNPQDVARVLLQIPAEQRLKVDTATMDLSDCMRAIVREAFPEATVVRDCFHVIKRAGEGIEELRLRFKREAVKDVNRQRTEFRKYLENLAKKRKQYRERRKKQGKKRCKGKKRGPKPKRMSTRFEPAKLKNEETLVESLTRCRTQLSKSRDKWTEKERERAKILFELYPKLEEAYNLVNDLRIIFRNKELDKETAKVKFTEWYGKVTKSTLREVKSVKDTIKQYEDEILNYFEKRETNASAESLNSKMKCFRSSLRGVRDIPFFFYRSMMVFG
jgi:transposase